MPRPEIINNTLTANTPEEMWECMHYLHRQGRTSYMACPISLVYGYGNVGGHLHYIGDRLEINPSTSDHIRNRRWWEESPNDNPGQLLLPFEGYTRCFITRIDANRTQADLVIRFAGHTTDSMSLILNRRLRSPSPYAVRAIRIHDVDRAVTEADAAPSTRQRSSWYVAEDGQARRREPMPSTAVEPRPLDLTWDAEVAEVAQARSMVRETNPCMEQPVAPDPTQDCDESGPCPCPPEPPARVRGRRVLRRRAAVGNLWGESAPERSRDYAEEVREQDRITRIAEAYSFVNYSGLRTPTTNNVRG